MFDIEVELGKLPDKPGVYLMHDASDAIIYVGKAISLKNRVRQYFQKRVRSPKIERMISLIDHFEYIVVGSEMEALVLECNLIKENRPKYNTMLMDDKTYPFIKVTVSEDFPRVYLTRHHTNDGSRYFGPYTSVESAKSILEFLKKIYKLRTCRKQITEGDVSDRPCLYHHMQLCSAPCAGKITKAEYRESIELIIDFLNGNSSKLKSMLTSNMKEASEKLEFEQAAVYRDLLSGLEKVLQVQRVTGNDEGDRDVLGLANAGDEAVVQVFFIRGGKMVGKEHFYLQGVEQESRSDILNAFVKQYYAATPSVPRELLLCEEIPEAEIVSQFLSQRVGVKISVKAPKRGDKEGLVKLACMNASNVLIQDSERLAVEKKKSVGAIAEIGELLGLEAPHRIEAYDISHISGFESVGSMVVYESGTPKKSDYRKFRIRTVIGADDYASMEEVLTRRFEHGRRDIDAQSEENSFTKFPDLIMMDGGRGQVNVALKVLSKLGLDIQVCGLVKDDSHRTRGIYYNNIEVPINTNSEAFKLITRIQDEVHRFAIEYHRSLRSKEQVHSLLDDIEGIGPTRRRALMRHFESLEKIRNASIEDIENCESMNRASAEAVYAFFHKGE